MIFCSFQSRLIFVLFDSRRRSVVVFFFAEIVAYHFLAFVHITIFCVFFSSLLPHVFLSAPYFADINGKRTYNAFFRWRCTAQRKARKSKCHAVVYNFQWTINKTRNGRLKKKETEKREMTKRARESGWKKANNNEILFSCRQYTNTHCAVALSLSSSIIGCVCVCRCFLVLSHTPYTARQILLYYIYRY